MEKVIIHKPDDRRANGNVVYVDFRRANAGEPDTFTHIAVAAARVLERVSG